MACITAKDFRENGYKYELTMEGSYYVSVQAVSIYGPGNWTKFVWVTIPGQTSMLVLAIVIPLITILVLVVTLLGAYQWKKNKEAMIFQGGLFSDNGAYVPMVSLKETSCVTSSLSHFLIVHSLAFATQILNPT